MRIKDGKNVEISGLVYFLIKLIQLGGSQNIMNRQKIATQIKNTMKRFCGDLCEPGSIGMPQCGQV